MKEEPAAVVGVGAVQLGDANTKTRLPAREIGRATVTSHADKRDQRT